MEKLGSKLTKNYRSRKYMEAKQVLSPLEANIFLGFAIAILKNRYLLGKTLSGKIFVA